MLDLLANADITGILQTVLPRPITEPPRLKDTEQFRSADTKGILEPEETRPSAA